MSAVAAEVAALVFDFDGLMIDTERVEADCVIQALADWGVEVTYADFGHLFGSVDADEEWSRLLQSWCGRPLSDLEAHIRAHATPLKDALPLMRGVRELLDAAAARSMPVGLATGNTLPTLERRLGRHGVFDCFDAIVTRADVARGKPAPDIYVEVARRLDVPAEVCLVLEDSALGCEAALAAGMDCCCRTHSRLVRILSVMSPALIAANNSDRSESVRVTGVPPSRALVRNTSKITPVTHQVVDPRPTAYLHHATGRPPSPQAARAADEDLSMTPGHPPRGPVVPPHPSDLAPSRTDRDGLPDPKA